EAGAQGSGDGPRALGATRRARLMGHGHLDDARVKRSRLDDHLDGPAEGTVAHAETLQQVDTDGSERRDVGDGETVATGDEGGDEPGSERRVEGVGGRRRPGAPGQNGPAPPRERLDAAGQLFRSLTAVAVEENDDLRRAVE